MTQPTRARFIPGRCNALTLTGSRCYHETDGGLCPQHRARPRYTSGRKPRTLCSGKSGGNPCQLRVPQPGDFCGHHNRAPTMRALLDEVRAMRDGVDRMMATLQAMQSGAP